MKMTQQHLDALVELENARCNGQADCKVPHTLIQEIESVIESLVRSGDTPGVPAVTREELEMLRDDLGKLWAMLPLSSYAEDAAKALKFRVKGWLSRVVSLFDCNEKAGA